MKICLVDDSRFQLMQTAQMITELGHEVETFIDSEKAVGEIKNGNFDCVVTDLLMPKIDGEKLVQLVKENNPEMFIVVVTANIQKTVENRCHDLGVNFFLNKPVTKEKLKPALSKIEYELGNRNAS